MDPPLKTGRDPVCNAIESFLRELEADGKGALEITADRGFVRLSFGELSVEAEDHDIAVIRLANRMMDDPRYTQILMAALRGQVQSADMQM